jgi:hypothetical protein
MALLQLARQHWIYGVGWVQTVAGSDANLVVAVAVRGEGRRLIRLLVAAWALKIFALPVRVIAVDGGRQDAFWLLHGLLHPFVGAPSRCE